jgi:hypothetical protein
MPDRTNDQVRQSVLAHMDRANQRVRTMLIVAALVEGAIIAAALILTNWKDPVQRLVFVVAIGTWTLIAIGLAILGAHISRSVSRLTAALSAER